MDNFIKRGLKWKQKFRHKNLTECVLVGDMYSTAKRLDATVTSSDDLTTADNPNGNIQYFIFMVRKCDLERLEIDIYKGLTFWRGKSDVVRYEVVKRNKQIFYYDDPDKLDINIITRLVEDTSIVKEAN